MSMGASSGISVVPQAEPLPKRSFAKGKMTAELPNAGKKARGEEIISFDQKLASLLDIFEDRFPFDHLIESLRKEDGDLDRCITLLLTREGHKARKGAGQDTPTTNRQSRSPRQPKITAAFAPPLSSGATSASPTPSPPYNVQGGGKQDSPVGHFAATEGSNASRYLETRQNNEKNAFDVLRWTKESELRARKRRRGKSQIVVLSLEDVSSVLPCDFVQSFLPSSLADELLRELMRESLAWEKPDYVINERRVIGRRSWSLYQFTEEGSGMGSEGTVPGAQVQGGEQEAYYKYENIKTRRSAPRLLEEARQLIIAKVNEDMDKRERHSLEVQGKWLPNVAIANHYDNNQESVDWHSDRLTYIGPMPTIASLTLGARRAFRIRAVVPKNSLENEDQGVRGEIIYEVPLPHNSLLVMRPPMQEKFRHSVPSVPVSQVESHPIAGTRRINLTFRYYRPEYAPNKTPNCYCGCPSTLRVANKVSGENAGRYFYFCAGNVVFDEGGENDEDEWAATSSRDKPAIKKERRETKQCRYFKWLDQR